MSTRSRIGLEMPNKHIKSIYCHFDGYPEGVGETLKKHYATPRAVEALLALGDLSILGEFYDKTLAEKHWRWLDKGEEMTDSDKKRLEKMTVPYTDRGEEKNEPHDDENEARFIERLGDSWEEYGYILKTEPDGSYKWYIYEANH